MTGDGLTYAEGSPFPGRIGRTVSESTPAWPKAPMPRAGAPNVVIVLLDDVGFAQLSPYGADIHTPTFARLADGGVRYRSFRTTALCTPSRACLLTGRNHHANACGTLPEFPGGFPGYSTRIPRENGFLSEILREAGYATFALGKWHLTPIDELAVGSTHRRWPLGRGFDRFYGFLGGRTSQWHPDLIYDNHAVTPPSGPGDGYHLNVDLADRAIEFVSDLRAAEPDRPFFMYYCPGAGHSPHHVGPEWADRYSGGFDLGWERWRDDVFRRQVALGIVPTGTELTPRPDVVSAWDDLGEGERRLYARQMEVFAGFVEHTDHHIGRLVDFLEYVGELDNTIVVVASDNGAAADGGPHGRNGRSTDPASHLAVLDEWGGPTTDPNYSVGWAWAGNTPLRRWKRFVHEGGIADPLIIHWPAGIAARGEIRSQYVHITDLAPTILELVGIEPPAELTGVVQSPMHGVSFAHTLDDATAPTRKVRQYYEMFGSRALWADGWKLVTAQLSEDILTGHQLDSQRWELYHVDDDFSEGRDLAREEPDILRRLVDLWWSEAGRHDVLPLDARHRRPPPRRDRDRYEYYPGVALPASASPELAGRSFSITAEIELGDAEPEGVLLAHGGGWYGGYSLYVKDGRLCFATNDGTTAEQRVDAEVDLRPGTHSVAVAFAASGDHSGTAVLLVDGADVGRGAIIMRETLPRATEGLSCGRDTGQSVTAHYDAPFPFTGVIRRVVVELTRP